MRSRLWLLLPALLAALTWAPATRAAEKSFAVPEVDIIAAVAPDGSLTVDERRIWAFTGSFSKVTQVVLHPAGTTLADLSVGEPDRPYREGSDAEPGRFLVTRQSDRTTVSWRFAAENESRTFLLHYRVSDAVRVHTDVAELYWQFIGKDWDVATGRARVTLRLPPGAQPADLRAWGHGWLGGLVSIDSGQQVSWSVNNLPAHRFLEGRTVFPTSLVPRGGRRDDRATLGEILAEEQVLADAANRGRLDVRLVLAVLALGVILFIAVLLLGRGPRGSFTGPYYRELPAAYSPAEAGVLWRKRGPVGGPELAATLLDLARRRHLQLVPAGDPTARRSKQDLEVVRADTGTDALRSHEQLLLDFLFAEVAGGADRMLLSAVPGHPAHQIRAFLTSWRRELAAAGTRLGFWDPSAGRFRALGCLTFVLLGIGGAGLALRFGLGISAMVWAGVALVCGVAVLLWRWRSPRGADDYSKWVAFRRFLAHFSRLDQAEVPALVLWEQYLVYATVLGVARQCLAQMRNVLPRIPEVDRLAWEQSSPWLMHSGFAHAGFQQVEQITAAVDSWQSAVAAVSTPSSSGAGSGGGFSAGGGGGDGGGGGTAA